MNTKEYINGFFGGLFWSCILCADLMLLANASTKCNIVLKIVAFVVELLIFIFMKSKDYLYFFYKKAILTIFFAITFSITLFVFNGIKYYDLLLSSNFNSVTFEDLMAYIIQADKFSGGIGLIPNFLNSNVVYDIIINMLIFVAIIICIDFFSLILISKRQKRIVKKAKKSVLNSH